MLLLLIFQLKDFITFSIILSGSNIYCQLIPDKTFFPLIGLIWIVWNRFVYYSHSVNILGQPITNWLRKLSKDLNNQKPIQFKRIKEDLFTHFQFTQFNVYNCMFNEWQQNDDKMQRRRESEERVRKINKFKRILNFTNVGQG